jgi:DNA (cytosine-5)-methyltransferase 1
MTKQILSLFAGAGGLDLGFHREGYTTVWANEYDKQIAPTYKHNFPSVTVDTRSLLDIPNSDLPNSNIDVVIGGPPCQSFSVGGAQRGFDDPRGKLIHQYLRVIAHVSPKKFVMENVAGLLNEKNVASFAGIIQEFEKLGYKMSWRLLNAKDFNVPQDRKRVFLVGSKEEVFNFDTVITTKIRPTLREALTDLPALNNEQHKDPGFSSMYLSGQRVRDWDQQSYTILATQRHIPLHPQAPKMVKIAPMKFELDKSAAAGIYRRFTIRECARIQTFPDSYEFLYSKPVNGYKMIGNAVPVNLANAIAKVI